MKRLLMALVLLIASTGVFAQAAPKKDSKTKTVKLDSAKTKMNAAGPTKKDGSADMRYKANKEAKTTAPKGPTKKDGTADMRYKANKKDSTKKN